jgi:CRP/FNR family transcriptional regulator, cyclic AMP receptor protein
MPVEIQSELFKQKTIELIHKFKILHDLSMDELVNLMETAKNDYKSKIVKLVQYEPGEAVIREGEYDSWMFWVLRGKYLVKKGDVSIAEFQTPGDVFGEMSALEVDTRSATVISEGQGVCFSMDLSILNNLKNHSIRLKIQEGIQRLKSERLALTTEKLAAEKQRVADQQTEIEQEKKRLEAKELELEKREQLLIEREKKV